MQKVKICVFYVCLYWFFCVWKGIIQKTIKWQSKFVICNP